MNAIKILGHDNVCHLLIPVLIFDTLSIVMAEDTANEWGSMMNEWGSMMNEWGSTVEVHHLSWQRTHSRWIGHQLTLEDQFCDCGGANNMCKWVRVQDEWVRVHGGGAEVQRWVPFFIQTEVRSSSSCRSNETWLIDRSILRFFGEGWLAGWLAGWLPPKTWIVIREDFC